MPCRDYEDGWNGQAFGAEVERRQQREEQAELRRKLSTVEAMLCGVLTVLENASQFGNVPITGNAIGHVFDRFDYDESGITRKELINWWKKHKLEDELRRAEEARKVQALIDKAAAEKALAEAKASAIAKLTPAERKALGL